MRAKRKKPYTPSVLGNHVSTESKRNIGFNKLKYKPKLKRKPKGL